MLTSGPALEGRDLRLGYRGERVVHGVSVSLSSGRVTALVGPNGSGKSTVLRSLARLHKIDVGAVLLPGDVDARRLSAREFAHRVTLLSQSRPQPSGLAVRDVVAFGRHPHRSRFSGLGTEDRQSIDRALEVTGTMSMADRAVDELSGGELQRVWLATCLAQDTGVLLLDEPTNHLDLRYQVDILDLVRELADEHGVAVGVVLHDLNLAAAVADEIVLLHQGVVRRAGEPRAVLESSLLSEVYGLTVRTVVDLDLGTVRVEPRGRHHLRRRP